MANNFSIYVYEAQDRTLFNNTFDNICQTIIDNKPIKDQINSSVDIRDLKLVGNIYTGYLANLRTENLPHLAKINDTQEREIPKDEDEALLEKAHFLYSKSTGYLFFQVNAKAFKSPNYIEKILTNRGNKTVILNPVLTTDAQTRLRNHQKSIYKFEINVASPDIQSFGNTTLENSIKSLALTTSKVKLILSNDKRQHKFINLPLFDIFRRVEKNATKFIVHSSELDSPIDLLVERKKFRKSIEVNNGYVSSGSAYEKLEECRSEFVQ